MTDEKASEQRLELCEESIDMGMKKLNLDGGPYESESRRALYQSA